MAILLRVRISAFARKASRLCHEFVFMRAPEVAAVRILSVVANLGFLALVNRYAGDVIAGQFLALYALILIVSSLARMGAEQYLIASLPRTAPSDQSAHISSLLAAVVCVTALLMGVTAAATNVWNLSFAFGASWSTFFLFWAAILFLSLNWVGVGALRGVGRYLQSVSQETLVYFSIFIVFLLLVGSRRRIVQEDLLLALVASFFISVVLGFSLLAKAGTRPKLATAAEVLESCRQSVSYWLAASLSVLNAWLPTLLLGLLAAPQEVGAFTISYRLAMLLLFGLMILNPRYAHEYSRLSASGQTDELISLYRRNTVSQLPFLIFALCSLAVASSFIFDFANIDSSEAYVLLAILSVGTFVSAVCGPIVTASLATGHARLVSGTMAVTVGLSALIVFLFKNSMNALLVAQIVAVTVASQNLILYVLWMSRQKLALSRQTVR
ncbi:MAG: hypothetical protein HKN84_05950 [Gammaproteobacteria bacterium]|nr:hypothetical protein [Gammaproteobacteria bacterium]